MLESAYTSFLRETTSISDAQNIRSYRRHADPQCPPLVDSRHSTCAPLPAHFANRKTGRAPLHPMPQTRLPQQPPAARPEWRRCHKRNFLHMFFLLSRCDLRHAARQRHTHTLSTSRRCARLRHGPALRQPSRQTRYIFRGLPNTVLEMLIRAVICTQLQPLRHMILPSGPSGVCTPRAGPPHRKYPSCVPQPILLTR